MKGKKRLEFMYNEGVTHGAIGYYKTVDEGYDKFKAFYSHLGIITTFEAYDYVAFKLGFKKAQSARIRVMKMKASAEEVIKTILAEREGKGEVSQAKHFTELAGYKLDNPS